jgi:hypothetical protein
MKKLFTIALSGNALGVHYSLFTLIALLLVSCGYKPSSQYLQNTFDENIYVEVVVDRAEPENAPFVKDAINRLVYTRFKGRVTSKEQAGSTIRISYAGTTFTPLAYENGYVTRYRVNVRVNFDMMTKQGRIRKNISTITESDIQAGSVDSSNVKIEAIRIGLAKSLDEFLAYVSARSANVK